MTPIIRSGYAPPKATKHKLYGYHRTHWKTIRAQRLALDSHRCTIQLPGCTTTATTVHLDPQLNGNHAAATLGNTRSACHHCHGKIDGNGSRNGFHQGGGGAIPCP